MAEKTLVYAYVEFAPAWIYHGWWFYAAPIVDGQPDRQRAEWLNRMSWKLDNLMRALGLEPLGEYRYGLGEKAIDAFLAKFPSGALLRTDGREFEFATDCGVDAWRCLKWVRREQLMDFVRDAERREKATEAAGAD